VEEAIVENVDSHQWEVQRAVEAEERAGLLQLLEGRS
jgi:hypothetical protein